MSTTTQYELLAAMRDRYKNASKSLKKQILNDFYSLCNYNRKYAIRLFNSLTTLKSIENLSKRGRKKIYSDPIILQVLRDIWITTNLPCSKRLKAIISLWLPFYTRRTLYEDIQLNGMKQNLDFWKQNQSPIVAAL